MARPLKFHNLLKMTGGIKNRVQHTQVYCLEDTLTVVIDWGGLNLEAGKPKQAEILAVGKKSVILTVISTSFIQVIFT